MLSLLFLIQYQSINHLQPFFLLTLITNVLMSPVTLSCLAILLFLLILSLISVFLELKLTNSPISIHCLSSITYAVLPLTFSLLCKKMFFSVFFFLQMLLLLLVYLSFLSLLFHYYAPAMTILLADILAFSIPSHVFLVDFSGPIFLNLCKIILYLVQNAFLTILSALNLMVILDPFQSFCSISNRSYVFLESCPRAFVSLKPLYNYPH